MQVDVAIVGAGGAGLSLLLALDRAFPDGASAPRIALIDPVRRGSDDRTWCWWANGPGPLDPLLERAWPRMAVVGHDGKRADYDLGQHRYVMLRSARLYAAARDAAARLGAVHIEAEAGTPVPCGDGVRIDAGSQQVSAAWAFDSRPVAPRRPGGTFLLQHFRGWFVRFERPLLDDGVAVLMDFDTRQPPTGVAFSYVLPLSPERALVEYTEFSPARLPHAAYDEALASYLSRSYPGVGYTVEQVEDGAIPMTDAPFAATGGARVVRIGTAGGATRPSTGYTFAAIQRQVDDVAQALRAGRPPLPRPAYPARHRWMDAVLLRALRTGTVDGPQLFVQLFGANPTERVVRFLDGATSPREDLAVMRSTPTAAMAGAAAADAAGRVQRRLKRSVATGN